MSSAHVRGDRSTGLDRRGRRTAPDQTGDDRRQHGRRRRRVALGVGDGGVSRRRQAGSCRLAGEAGANGSGTSEGGVAVGRRGGEVPRHAVAVPFDRRADGVTADPQGLQLPGELLGERLRCPPTVVEPRLCRQHERLRLDADTPAVIGVAGGEAEHDAERAVEPHRRVRVGHGRNRDIPQQSPLRQRGHRIGAQRPLHLLHRIHPFRLSCRVLVTVTLSHTDPICRPK